MKTGTIFIILIVCAVILSVVGFSRNRDFFDDTLQQLFWLVTGVLATTFIVEKILQAEEKAKDIRRDSFAFRSFTANLFFMLINIRNREKDFGDSIYASVFAGPKVFETAIQDISKALISTTALNQERYDQLYLDVAGGIRDIAHNYIRLYSESEEEMVLNYKKLVFMASRWKYHYEFSKGFHNNADIRDGKDPIRKKYQQETEAAIHSVNTTINETIELLSKLVVKASSGKGYYP